MAPELKIVEPLRPSQDVVSRLREIADKIESGAIKNVRGCGVALYYSGAITVFGFGEARDVELAGIFLRAAQVASESVPYVNSDD